MKHIWYLEFILITSSARCNGPIDGNFVMIGDAVNGTRVHEACFKQPTCADCGNNLREYLEKNGKLFCPDCFQKNFPNTVVKAVGRQGQ